MRILITGGTNGMGKGVAMVLAEQGHEVVVHGRSRASCEATVAEITGRTGNEAVSFVVADLTSLTQVRAAIDDIGTRFESLDGLFVNAGLGYAPSRVETEDGMDAHFQVNYLSHFMLTVNLLPLLERSATGGRVIFNTPSFGELDFDDLQMKQNWGYERGIGVGMVAKRMFLLQLHELYEEREATAPSFIGFEIAKTVWTNQLNIIPFGMRIMATIAKLFGSFISIEECGQIMAPLFTEDHATSLERSGALMTFKDGAFTEIPHSEAVLDSANRERLWRVSVELCDDGPTTRHAEALSTPGQ